MLFHKPLVSLVAAIALASSVTASATPVRRTNPVPAQDCDTNNLTCCSSTSTLGALGILGTLLSLVPGVNANLLVGLTCTLTGTVAW